jgi:hypothetical protein
MSEQWVVVIDGRDETYVHGIFESNAEAVEFAERQLSGDDYKVCQVIDHQA